MSDNVTIKILNRLKSTFNWLELIILTSYVETKYSVSIFMLSHWDGIPNELTLLFKTANSPSGPPCMPV